jgi:hypothetical protein
MNRTLTSDTPIGLSMIGGKQPVGYEVAHFDQCSTNRFMKPFLVEDFLCKFDRRDGYDLFTCADRWLEAVLRQKHGNNYLED